MFPVVILAGGVGTRLGALTAGLPKPLVDVCGEPFLAHQLRLLRRHGISRVVISVAYRAEAIESAIGDGSRYGLRIDYVHDGDAPLGTGGAVCRALPLTGDSFFVMYGDSFLDIDYAAVQNAFVESDRLALMVVYRNAGSWDRSNVRFVDGQILAYDKWNPEPDMAYIDYGLGVFHRAAFDTVRLAGPTDLAVVYQRLLASGELAAYEAPRRFFEVGSPEGLAEFRQLVRERQEQKG